MRRLGPDLLLRDYGGSAFGDSGVIALDPGWLRVKPSCWSKLSQFRAVFRPSFLMILNDQRRHPVLSLRSSDEKKAKAKLLVREKSCPSDTDLSGLISAPFRNVVGSMER